MTIYVKLPPNSGHLSIMDKFFKTRRCPLFRGFTVFSEHLFLGAPLKGCFWMESPYLLRTFLLTVHFKAAVSWRLGHCSFLCNYLEAQNVECVKNIVFRIKRKMKKKMFFNLFFILSNTINFRKLQINTRKQFLIYTLTFF